MGVCRPIDSAFWIPVMYYLRLFYVFCAWIDYDERYSRSEMAKIFSDEAYRAAPVDPPCVKFPRTRSIRSQTARDIARRRRSIPPDRQIESVRHD